MAMASKASFGSVRAFTAPRTVRVQQQGRRSAVVVRAKVRSSPGHGLDRHDRCGAPLHHRPILTRASMCGDDLEMTSAALAT